MNIIIKRSGQEVPFDGEKIRGAVVKANNAVGSEHRMSEAQVTVVVENVSKAVLESDYAMGVEDIQDKVELEIMQLRGYEVAQAFIRYRHEKHLIRTANTIDDEVLALLELCNEEVLKENANKNPIINSTQRDYMAGAVSKDLTTRLLLPADVVEAHKEGIIHFHDADYFAQHMHNCDLVNLEDMLQNGTVITDTLIEKPHTFSTACNITAQIIAQVASNQYGGQSFSLAHLAPFVEVSRQKFRREVTEELTSYSELKGQALEEAVNAITEKRLLKDVSRGIQTIQYQLLTLMTTNGQTPFVTMYMYLDEVEEGQTRDDLAMLIEEVLNQRILGVKNRQGRYITPAFPKLIYVLDEDNIHNDSRYYSLTELAAKCTAKRMVPDYISAKVMMELKGDIYTCMGCRSFLTAEDGVRNPDGSRKFYGRFNQGVVTINLPDVACASNGNMELFWKLLDERLELCHKALRCRHERLKGTISDVAPILWQYGALARLEKGQTIDHLLYGGYSTISLGYAGLYEMCMRMTGKSHTDPEAKPFALSVMQYMNDKCKEWRASENIAYSVYGTPLESTTYKFAKALQKRYGKIKDVTDHSYITNSYHVCVREEIDAFTKLSFEAEFQKLSPGGAISYVEVPDMQSNIPAVIAIMRHIYNNIMYAELNTKSDYCQVCGFDGEINIVEDENGKLVWECPNCGNRNHDLMNVARRTCGYIGVHDFNQGRLGDINDRVTHIPG